MNALLASHPQQDEFLEFHIKKLPQGQFSGWLSDAALLGDEIELQGPMGQCIFTAKPDQAVLLSATGTGLAPILGLLKDAISHHHSAPIHVLLAANQSSEFYLVSELLELEEQQPNISVEFLSLNDKADFSYQEDIYQYCKEHFSDMRNWRVFLCGKDSFVKKMRRHCFLSGAAMNDISADVFLPFAT